MYLFGFHRVTIPNALARMQTLHLAAAHLQQATEFHVLRHR